MKLLLDENLSRRIVPLLQQNYPDSTQVVLVSLERANDIAIWEFARNNDYVLVTKDSDFHELSLLYGAPPKIIWIKSGNSDKEFVAEILNKNVDEIINSLLDQNVNYLEIY